MDEKEKTIEAEKAEKESLCRTKMCKVYAEKTKPQTDEETKKAQVRGGRMGLREK